MLADVPGDGVHQMGLAEPHPAVQEQRIERHRIDFRHPLRGGIGELVRLADHELVEGEPRIQRRADAVRRRLLRRRPCRDGRLLGGVRRGGLAARFGGPGEPVAMDDHVDAAHFRILHLPQIRQPVGVMADHPVLHESRRDRQTDLPAGELANAHGLQPASIGGLPDLRPQSAANGFPLRTQPTVKCPFIHCNRPHFKFAGRFDPTPPCFRAAPKTCSKRPPSDDVTTPCSSGTLPADIPNISAP